MRNKVKEGKTKKVDLIFYLIYLIYLTLLIPLFKDIVDNIKISYVEILFIILFGFILTIFIVNLCLNSNYFKIIFKTKRKQGGKNGNSRL